MRNLKTNIIASLLIIALTGALPAAAQSFEKVELLVPNGKKVDERSVVVSFTADTLVIETTGAVKITKSFKYTDIRTAEYSFTKNPRWKTGVGLGIASIAFPPLLLIALPMGFSKHRRHWLTIRTETDFAVLKLSKSNRKLIIPTFETRSGVRISGEGEEK